jgi:hypothetical protein
MYVRQREPAEPLTYHDFRRMCDALHLAFVLLAKRGTQEDVALVADVLEGRKKLELRRE